MYNPIGRAAREEQLRASASKGQSSIAAPAPLRIGLQDLGVVKLKVPPHLTHIIKERVDSCDMFRSPFEHKWIYWGSCLTIKLHKVGVMTFGGI